MNGRTNSKEIKKDDWAIVLDFLSHGRSGMDRAQPMAQVIGEKYFSLLDVIVRDNVNLKMGDRIYIGDAKREKIKYIRGRIEPKDLTVAAKEELFDIIENIINKNPKRFLDFFNSAGPVTTRLHQIELLHGVGKRHLWAIINERKSKPFESFQDLKKRVPLLPEPKKMVIKRILDELENKDKYRIFVPRMERRKGLDRRR